MIMTMPSLFVFVLDDDVNVEVVVLFDVNIDDCCGHDIPVVLIE